MTAEVSAAIGALEGAGEAARTYEEFMIATLRSISAGIGIPYELLIRKDFQR